MRASKIVPLQHTKHLSTNTSPYSLIMIREPLGAFLSCTMNDNNDYGTVSFTKISQRDIEYMFRLKMNADERSYMETWHERYLYIHVKRV